MLTFDEANHTYRWNGVIVPGVTSILRDFMQVELGGTRYHIHRFTGQVIPSDVMENAGAVGTDIHSGCQIIIQGGIDWSALDGAYVGPLREFEKWRDEFKPQILFTECPFYSQRYGYAGTIDIIAMIGKALCIIDIKTGEGGSVGPQTAAYEAGWIENNKYRAKTERWVLKLPKNGDPYKFQKITGAQDLDYFKACLYQYQYHKGGK